MNPPEGKSSLKFHNLKQQWKFNFKNPFEKIKRFEETNWQISIAKYIELNIKYGVG